MTQIVLSILSNWFHCTDAALRKHLATPRDHLFDLERQLGRQLRTRFRHERRAA